MALISSTGGQLRISAPRMGAGLSHGGGGGFGKAPKPMKMPKPKAPPAPRTPAAPKIPAGSAPAGTPTAAGG
jgi:hypothetical protein